ncbi:MAG: DUF2335 domain-containing protein [Eubacterium sp.]
MENQRDDEYFCEEPDDDLEINDDPDPYSEEALGESPNELMQLGSAFYGPLPPPETLEQYNKAAPDAANRIIQMAEEEMHHRHKQEDNMLKTDSRDSLLGIIAAVIVCLAVTIAGVLIVKFSSTAIGTISGSVVGISGLAGIFLKNTIPAYRRKKGDE